MNEFLLIVAIVAAIIGVLIGIDEEDTLKGKINNGLMMGIIFPVVAVLAVVGVTFYMGWVLLIVMIGAIVGWRIR